MRKKTLALFLTCVLAAGMLAGCGNKDSKDNNQVENSQGTESAKDDQAAADEVAELIDAIYVQERTDKTDEQCSAAKEAWDKLTDAQKALVSGENADPDYFGRDTGWILTAACGIVLLIRSTLAFISWIFLFPAAGSPSITSFSLVMTTFHPFFSSLSFVFFAIFRFTSFSFA